MRGVVITEVRPGVWQATYRGLLLRTATSEKRVGKLQRKYPTARVVRR